MELKDEYFISVSTKKRIAIRNALYMEYLAKENKILKDRLENRAIRIKECLNYWELKITPMPSARKHHLLMV